ncbi:Factor required for polyglutamate synthesis [Bacillus subtilis QB928]|nr:Factor required for polyglutamate synthesis [Bacillus subtilis QB928]
MIKMKFVKAIWPFVAVAIVFMFMSAFKFNDQLTDQEKQKIDMEMNKIQQQEEPVNANK